MHSLTLVTSTATPNVHHCHYQNVASETKFALSGLLVACKSEVKGLWNGETKRDVDLPVAEHGDIVIYIYIQKIIHKWVWDDESEHFFLRCFLM